MIERVVRDRDADDRDVHRQRRGEKPRFAAPRARALQRQRAEHDVNDEQGDLGRQPVVSERVLTQHRREHQRGREQHGVDGV